MGLAFTKPIDSEKNKNLKLLKEISCIKLTSSKLKEKNDKLQKSLKDSHATLEGKSLVHAKLLEAHEKLKAINEELQKKLEASKNDVFSLRREISDKHDLHKSSMKKVQEDSENEVKELKEELNSTLVQLKDSLRFKRRMKKLFVDEKLVIIRKYVHQTSGFFSNPDEDIDHLSSFLDFALKESNSK